jgi:threonine dehydrogenase-like Zn-dependent dehydrogenase
MQSATCKAKAYSAAGEKSPLASTTIPRRDPTERDVQIEVLFCGICHFNLHSVHNEWSEFMATNYSIVPGNEIVGRVTKVGSAVNKYKPGVRERNIERGRGFDRALGLDGVPEGYRGMNDRDTIKVMITS